MKAGGAASFDLRGGTLYVCGDLGLDEEAGFEQALAALVRAEADALVLDLSGVDYLGSGYVRYLALTMVEAKRRNRPIALLAKKRTARLLHLAGLDKLGTVEVVD